MLNSINKRYNVRLNIDLTPTAITLIRTSGWFKKKSTVLTKLACKEEDLAAQLRSTLAEFKCNGLAVSITLSDAMVRLWSVTPPQNTARLSDCQAATAARFQTLYGESMTDWEMAADWNARHPFLACAMPRKLLEALKQIAQEHQLTLLEIVPQFIATWNHWRTKISSTSWFGVLQDNVLTIGAIDQRRLCVVRATALSSEALTDKAWLPQHLKREALRLNLALPSQLQLCGPIPGHWVIQTAGTLRCTRLDAHQTVDSATIASSVVAAQAGAQEARR